MTRIRLTDEDIEFITFPNGDVGTYSSNIKDFDPDDVGSLIIGDNQDLKWFEQLKKQILEDSDKAENVKEIFDIIKPMDLLDGYGWIDVTLTPEQNKKIKQLIEGLE